MNPREMDVLNILWNSKEPMMANDIVNAGDSGLTQSTVSSVLRKLLKEELVEVVGTTHSGKVLSRTYRPTEKSKEALLNYFVDQYMAFSNVISMTELQNAIREAKKAEKN